MIRMIRMTSIGENKDDCCISIPLKSLLSDRQNQFRSLRSVNLEKDVGLVRIAKDNFVWDFIFVHCLVSFFTKTFDQI